MTTEQLPAAPKTTLTNPAHQLGGSINPTAVVLHRTIGSWPGDLSVGTHGGAPGYISFHFLIGQAPGEWTQFIGPDGEGVGHLMNHAAGANDWAFGIEISGDQGEALTDWQVDRVAEILQWARDEWGIAPTKYDGAQGRIGAWSGIIDHRHIAAPAGLAHSDGLDDEDWNRIAAKIGGAPIISAPAPAPAPSGSGLLRRGSSGPAVADLQTQLAALGYAPGPIDGQYGPLTEASVRRFQADHGCAVDGIVGNETRRALSGAVPAPSGGLLAQGSQGPEVARLQTALRDAGFDPGPIDGQFGPLTARSVAAYQSAHGLLVDSIVGPQTRGALGI